MTDKELREQIELIASNLAMACKQCKELTNTKCSVDCPFFSPYIDKLLALCVQQRNEVLDEVKKLLSYDILSYANDARFDKQDIDIWLKVLLSSYDYDVLKKRYVAEQKKGR